ncbi:MAG: DUF364 domain-containing protein [Bacteroidales bacterium]|nr:DUF364 domain-containing protein [Lentimicrobiaceae bacterium]MDD5696154.1 DUF364 domain-containing protein [Bacteroidales bacterium]
MILDDTYQLLKTKYHYLTDHLTISDVRFGVFLTAVRLSDNSVGFASTMQDDQFNCMKKNRDYGEYSPLHITGRTVSDLFESEKRSSLISTLKIAVMNAISSNILSQVDYHIIEDADPIELIDLDSSKTITLVGAFHSYIQKILKTNNRLYVLELNESALPDQFREYYVPASESGNVIPESDIVIITGFTLVNSTIDGLLDSVLPKTQVIVTGPSGSLIPDILFRNNVQMVGATRITNPDMLFTLVGEYGAGYHLFSYCAQKICILND